MYLLFMYLYLYYKILHYMMVGYMTLYLNLNKKPLWMRMCFTVIQS